MVSTISFSNNDIPDAKKIINSSKVEVSVLELEESFFEQASYNEDESMLEFITKDQISFIQIFNDHESLEFQLMVMSNKVMISKSLFNIGQSKLAFIIDGHDHIQFTDVLVNE